MPETAEFLLELGGEEMPAPWLAGLTAQLRDRFSEAASRERLFPRDVLAFSTPRRFVLRAQVKRRQDDREESVFGPALKVAKDAAGAWSAAAVGFARKNGVLPDALGEGAKDPARPTEKHLLFVKKVAGREAGEVVVGLLPALLRGLAFPKRMSWDAWLDDGKGAFPFGRPIRWIVALLGGQVLPFDIHELVAGGKGPVIVRAGDVTFGHRFLPRGSAGGPIRVTSFSDLEAKLEGAAVVLRAPKRRQTIEAALRAAGPVEDDHGLVDEWQDLVEHPAVVVGEVPSEFRSLPREVLETVLVHHQKYVPLLESGSVVRFAALTNSDGKAAEPIVRNMERVVVARLRDAAFFWKEDRKRPLADRVADLGGVTFHQGLGSYLDKTNRVVALVQGIEASALLPHERKAAIEAARLAKADLTTAMVREFPELQGAMGALYLEAEGVEPEVRAAVRWHYHPLSADPDSAPTGKLGPSAQPVFAAVSLADKLDTLSGYFGLGLEPTGSSDPFGLRRFAQGAIRVLLDFWPDGRSLDLEQLVVAAVSEYGRCFERSGADVTRAVIAFLTERLEHVLQARGFPAEEVAAVVGTPGASALRDVRDCLVRLKVLHRVRSEAPADFDHLAAAFKRANNLLRQAEEQAAASKTLGPLLGFLPSDEFPAGAERQLYDALQATRSWGPTSSEYSTATHYESLLRSLSTLRPAVDRFFDEVMVMADDPDDRRRRLELLNLTVRPFFRIADISRLGGQA